MNFQKERQQIDKIDNELLDLLQQRVGVVKTIGAIKKENGLPVFDPAREQALLSILKDKAAVHNVHPSFVTDIWEVILKYSKSAQSKL